MKYLILILITVLPQILLGQNNSIDVNSNLFIDWATTGTINRGFVNISDTTIVNSGSNRASYGVIDSCFGKPSQNNPVVSLGDSGYVTLSFNYPIVNGNGDDFAVFENGFLTPSSQDSMGFFELAFVEVSSDGINFVRFPSESNTQYQTQVGSFASLNNKKIFNLAGTSVSKKGTAFDLNDLSDSTNIDINNITHIRIVDAIGCIQNDFCSYDAFGNKVNDPWPTEFASCGFDLAGVGVINNSTNTKVQSYTLEFDVKIYPNPASTYLQVECGELKVESFAVFDIYDRKLAGTNSDRVANPVRVDISNLPKGIYFIKLKGKNKTITKRFIKL